MLEMRRYTISDRQNEKYSSSRPRTTFLKTFVGFPDETEEQRKHLGGQTREKIYYYELL